MTINGAGAQLRTTFDVRAYRRHWEKSATPVNWWAESMLRAVLAATLDLQLDQRDAIDPSVRTALANFEHQVAVQLRYVTEIDSVLLQHQAIEGAAGLRAFPAAIPELVRSQLEDLWLSVEAASAGHPHRALQRSQQGWLRPAQYRELTASVHDAPEWESSIASLSPSLRSLTEDEVRVIESVMKHSWLRATTLFASRSLTEDSAEVIKALASSASSAAMVSLRTSAQVDELRTVLDECQHRLDPSRPRVSSQIAHAWRTRAFSSSTIEAWHQVVAEVDSVIIRRYGFAPVGPHGDLAHCARLSLEALRARTDSISALQPQDLETVREAIEIASRTPEELAELVTAEPSAVQSLLHRARVEGLLRTQREHGMVLRAKYGPASSLDLS